MKRTTFSVTYGNSVARFSDRADALRFGRMVSIFGSAWASGGAAEVAAGDGIIGQFRDGHATDEFKHLED